MTTFLVPGIVNSRSGGSVAIRACGCGVFSGARVGHVRRRRRPGSRIAPASTGQTGVCGTGHIPGESPGKRGPRRQRCSRACAPWPGNTPPATDRPMLMPALGVPAAQLGRQDLAHDPVVARLFDHLFPQPSLEVARELPGHIFGIGLRQQQPAPDLGGTRGVGRAIEQPLDQGQPLALARVVQKIAGLGGRGNLADQVEADAPVEILRRRRSRPGESWPPPSAPPAPRRSGP